jgi:amino acid adenylation domain-containing protein
LHQLSRSRRSTLFMTLLAAFQVLLARYCNQTDIAVGTPVANRTRLEIEPLIGFFVNTLVLRTGLGGNPTFEQLLERVRQVCLEAYANQDVPFERLVSELQPARDLSRTPLFQVMFSFQNAQDTAHGLKGLRFKPDMAPSETSKFDLMLLIAENGQSLNGSWEYSSDLFDASTIDRLHQHFMLLLEDACDSPQRPIGDLRLMPEDEERRLLVTCNETHRSWPHPEVPVHDLAAQQAARTPEALAAMFHGAQLTYGDLDRTAGRLAAHLRKLGVGPDVRVGIFLERSLDLPIAVLATLKAGGACVPLDPAYPKERLATMLNSINAPVVLTQHRKLEALPPTTATVLCMDEWDWPAATCEPVSTHPDQAVYVIFTSGSTGGPKGVAMTHRGLANLLRWQLQEFREAPAARTLQFASLSFDVSFQEIFATLCSGGTLVIVSEEERRDPERLAAVLDNESVDRLFLPFVALNQLVEAAQALGCYPKRFSDIYTAGEQLRITPAMIEFARRTGCRLHNQYGPSETHVVTSYTLGGTGEDWPNLPPIGRAVANTATYILDRNLHPTPIGVSGELLLGGICLARGYESAPDATALKFIPDPFSPAPGSRMYKTGDLARYLADGNIEFLGRIDQQTKIQGYRIEPGEIESALELHPGVREAVVIARDQCGHNSLASYIVAARNPAPEAAELRRMLKQKLPEYMIPSSFNFVDVLPLTPSGKVDRRKLLEMEDVSSDADRSITPPRNQIQELLAGIWAEVLSINQVGVHDNFFDLGGHSLLATQLVSRIRSELNTLAPVRALFEAPTVAALANWILNAQSGQEGMGGALTRAARNDAMPVSHAQERLWFLNRLASNSAYNLPTGMRLNGRLNIPALARAIDELVRRHEALRTTFPERGGLPIQEIHSAATVPFPIIDLTGLPQDHRERAAGELASREFRGAFDLGRGPLIRVHLLQLDSDRHVFLLNMHHIVADGWSMGVIVRELGALYGAFSQRLPSPLPELTLQYTDFAVWQRKWLESGALEAQIQYWKTQLSGVRDLLLPADRPRRAFPTGRGKSKVIRLSRELSDSLQSLSRSTGVTLFMTLMGAFQALLHCYTGQDDIAVGTDVANRNRLEVEDLIGFFINQLVLRTDLSGDPSFRDVLRRVRRVALEAYANQDVPFSKLVEELNPKRTPGTQPLFQAKLVLQNAPVRRMELPGVELQLMEQESGGARFDLMLSLMSGPQGLHGILEYSTDLFQPSTIDAFAASFEMLLEKVTEDPGLPLPVLREMVTARRKEYKEQLKSARGKKLLQPRRRQAAIASVQ